MQWVVFTNVYVALCGALLTAATYALLGLPPRLDHVAGIVFCCTLVIYNLDRLVEPHPGDSDHERWIEQHRRVLWAVLAFAAAGVIGFATQLSPAAQWSLLPAGAVALGYCLPIAGRRPSAPGTRARLKDLPGAKLILIALVWTYATAVLPMLDSAAPFDRHTAMLLLARLCFIAAVALPFDLPDMQRDRRSGILTIPNWLGVRATRNVALLLIGLSAAFSLFTPWPFTSALLLGCVCVAGLLIVLRADRGVLYFMVALDGMLLVQAGLLWISAG
ncbi:MAG: UbiA family prenyltransferase [Phycisphaeraceae bacterium]|nr:UbiA family prenyltransferase [Phycisphaeraceae bacterium]